MYSVYFCLEAVLIKYHKLKARLSFSLLMSALSLELSDILFLKRTNLRFIQRSATPYIFCLIIWTRFRYII